MIISRSYKVWLEFIDAAVRCVYPPAMGWNYHVAWLRWAAGYLYGHASDCGQSFELRDRVVNMLSFEERGGKGPEAEQMKRGGQRMEGDERPCALQTKIARMLGAEVAILGFQLPHTEILGRAFNAAAVFAAA